MSGNELYDFSHPIFQKHFIFKRLAMEHIDLHELDSDFIEIQPTSTVGPLKIPTKYEVTYHLRTITGIKEDQSPIFGGKHVVEISLPKRYPLESAKIYMKTPVWHPNIQYHGKFRGRICGNTQNFGKGYGLRQLVLRIVEILEYKNYHAEHTHPFPEDGKVAEWVLEYAEPKGIVDKEKGILLKEKPGLKIKSEGGEVGGKAKLKLKFKGPK